MQNLGIKIQGDGIAARCCAHLLTQAGIPVSFEFTTRPRVPVIMLSEQAQQLIRDIFQRQDLFSDLPRILKRVVAWGSAPVEVEHSAVVVSEELLLSRLGMPAASEIEEAWTICASPPIAGIAHSFGSRNATPARVELKGSPETCSIEALEGGWLFLISDWLLSVGEPDFSASNLIKDQIMTVHSPTGQFPASPRMVSPLGGVDWIACGTAAMTFDPLCGDGTANAVREAILASAVIRAATQGEDPQKLLAHYEARLTAGFMRHLQQCHAFYSSGGNSDWWKAQAESAVQGIEWCNVRMNKHGAFRYQLRGLEIVAL